MWLNGRVLSKHAQGPESIAVLGKKKGNSCITVQL